MILLLCKIQEYNRNLPKVHIDNFISDYMEGVITREQFWVLAKFKYPTHQIAFCTDAALKCLKYRDCEVL